MVDFRGVRGSASFYFIRHGESEGNRAGVIQGLSPSPLTDKGREQARKAGAWFRPRGIQLVLSSPLGRAEQTARIIAEEAHVSDVRLIAELSEIDTGVFSNVSFEQARATYPDAWIAFHQKSWEGVPGAEKIDGLVARSEAAWRTILSFRGQGKTNILCVSHGGFLQWLIRVTLGVEHGWMPLIATSANCGVSLLEVDNHELAKDAYSYYAAWTMINAAADGAP